MGSFIYYGGLNPGSLTITTPGAGFFEVPAYAQNLRVRAFGAGAGGYGKSGTGDVLPVTPGGATTFEGLTSGGGAATVGGTASGGDTNTNGTSGAGLFGDGAAAPRPDAGGGAQKATPPGNSTQNGLAGNPYGGGGTSAVYWNGSSRWVGAGGGSGAFVEKVYPVGSLSAGSLLAYTVGAGGPGADGTSSDGGVGANGALIFDWDY